MLAGRGTGMGRGMGKGLGRGMGIANTELNRKGPFDFQTDELVILKEQSLRMQTELEKMHEKIEGLVKKNDRF